MINVDFSNLPAVTNKKFYPLYFDKNRYLVLVGGGGSGKSVYAASKIIYRCMTEPGHKFLVVRKVKETLRDSVFAELIDCIDRWGIRDLWKIPKGRSSELYLRCINGSEILFFGLDDVEKRKSIKGITGVWIEEASEVEPKDFRQINIRLRGKTKHYKQIILTFNPIYKGHWLEEEFLYEDWSPRKPECTTCHSTYKDNRFLDQENIDVLVSFRDIDPYYYMVYCLGEWGILGQTIFPAQLVTERLIKVRKIAPLARGLFVYEYFNHEIVDSSIRWLDDEKGPVIIYEYPQDDVPYCCGGDTAGDGSNYFAGQMLNTETQNQAAVLHHQYDEDDYARQMYCLGKFYGEALLSVETNYSTFPVKELQRLGYAWQWKRERIDRITKKTEARYGWVTTTKTRPLAIAQAVKWVKENIDCINDVKTLEEMLTFVRNEKGKAEAMEGKFDDLILSLAISISSEDQAGHHGTSSFLAGGPDGKPGKKDQDFDREDDEDDEENQDGYW